MAPPDGTPGWPARPSSTTPIAPVDVPRFDYTFTVPGLFAQDDVELRRGGRCRASARAGSSQRVRLVPQPARLVAASRGGGWTSRVSFGTGFFGPTRADRRDGSGRSDAARRSRGRSRPNAAERLVRPDAARSVQCRPPRRSSGPASATRSMSSGSPPTRSPTSTDRRRTPGVELLGTVRRAPFAVTGTYTYVRAREQRRRHGRRCGAHAASLGRARRPWRSGKMSDGSASSGTTPASSGSKTDPSAHTQRTLLIVGLLAERRFGRVPAVRQRREPDRDPADELVAAAASGPSGGWPRHR